MSDFCKHKVICGLPVHGEGDCCILHSADPNKEKDYFEKRFEEHIRKSGFICDNFVFPIELDYSRSALQGMDFNNEASFDECMFLEKADFSHCVFSKKASFRKAIFNEEVFFHDTNFCESADFISAIFKGYTDFGEAKFHKDADLLLGKFFKRVEFFGTVFHQEAEFRDSIFYDGARFLETEFNGKETLFSFSSFLAPTYFSSGRNKEPIFKGTELLFEEVTINPSNILAFKNTDFRKAVFRGTDMRNVELSGVQWAIHKNRIAVYDEILLEKEKDEIVRYDTLEELYRHLKHNYSDRRDYLNAGQFHYGEKETIRKNPRTSSGIRLLLNLYKAVSGYGERILPAFICVIMLFLVSGVLYYFGGIEYSTDTVFIASETLTTLDYILHSAEAMFFLRPSTYVSASYLTSFTMIIQSVLSPIFIALLALAIRQRLKR